MTNTHTNKSEMQLVACSFINQKLKCRKQIGCKRNYHQHKHTIYDTNDKKKCKKRSEKKEKNKQINKSTDTILY